MSFELFYAASRVQIAPYSFHVTPYTPGPDEEDPDTGSVGLTDLAKVSPVPGSLGNAVTAGVSVIDVNMVGDALVFSLSDGSTLPPVTVPQIAAADDAADAAAASATAASGSASAASGSASAAAGSATAAQDSANAAEAAVDSFGLSIGTVTTGAPGSSAAATVTGGPDYELGLTIPQGPEGPPGPG